MVYAGRVASPNGPRLDDDEKDGVGITDAIGREQQTTVVNESGVYSLILTSRKPAAKAFKKWVTGEVLPSIQKDRNLVTPPGGPKEMVNPGWESRGF